MRYSEIVGSKFYRIGLSPPQLELVDAHYLAAAHHRQRALQGPEARAYHAPLFAQHVERLFSLVASGDFSRAVDPLGHGLDAPNFWRPPPARILAELDLRRIEACLPDPGMFREFPADYRYGACRAYPYDRVLEDAREFRPALLELLSITAA